jgi:hypothetical protein
VLAAPLVAPLTLLVVLEVAEGRVAAVDCRATELEEGRVDVAELGRDGLAGLLLSFIDNRELLLPGGNLGSVGPRNMNEVGGAPSFVALNDALLFSRGLTVGACVDVT